MSASGTFAEILLEVVSNGFDLFSSRFDTRSNLSMLANLEKAWSAKDAPVFELELVLAAKGLDESVLSWFIVKIAGSEAILGAT